MLLKAPASLTERTNVRRDRLFLMIGDVLDAQINRDRDMHGGVL